MTTGHDRNPNFFIIDTACAKCVAGDEWAKDMIQYYKDTHGYDLQSVKEKEPSQIRAWRPYLLGVCIHSASSVGQFSGSAPHL